MAIFTSKIRCYYCGRTFKRKKERGKYKWVCNGYETGKCNKRIPIEEKVLIEAIQKRYLIRFGKNMSEEYIKNNVEWIKVEDKLLFEIKLKDFEDTIYYGKKHIIF